MFWGRLHPRERLIEDELIERFGAKRHVIRQALLDLERMGVIERVPNRGAQVRSYTAAAVQHLYEMREMLETTAASLIPMPLSDAALDELRRIQALHEDAVRKGDLKKVFRQNIAFHWALFANCGNPYLTAAINDYSHRAHVIRFHSLNQHRYMLHARDEHRAMIAAIEACDRQAPDRTVPQASDAVQGCVSETIATGMSAMPACNDENDKAHASLQ